MTEDRQAGALAETKLPWELKDRLVAAACEASGRRLGDRFIGGEVVAAFFSELAKGGYGVFPIASSPMGEHDE